MRYNTCEVLHKKAKKVVETKQHKKVHSRIVDAKKDENVKMIKVSYKLCPWAYEINK